MNQRKFLGLTTIEQIFRICLQLLTTFLISRLVAPEAFGWSAITSMLISGVTALTQISTEPLIISSDNLDNQTLNKIWSLGLILNLLAGSGLSLLAIFAFHDSNPRIVLIGSASSLIAWSYGAVSRALINKENGFKRLMQIGILSSFANLLSSFSLASVFHSGTFALVGGQFFAILVSTVLVLKSVSHSNHFMIPKMLDSALFNFFRNNILSTLSNFAARNTDTMMIILSLGILQLAFYDRAYALVYSAQIALSQTYSRVLLPKYSRSNTRINEIYFADLRNYAMVSVVMNSPFFLFPLFITRVLYGRHYESTAKLLPYLAIAGVLQSFSSLSGTVLLALRRADQQLRLAGISFVIYVASFVYVRIDHPSLLRFALANIFAAGMMVLVTTTFLNKREIGLQTLKHVESLLFPAAILFLFWMYLPRY